MTCDCCRVAFHLAEVCSGLSGSEQRAVVLQKRLLMYLCAECRNAFKSAPMVIKKVEKLQEEVVKLKKEIEVLKSSSTSNTEQILFEAHERHIRSRNLMVFDVPELANSGLQDKIKHDTSVVHNIFQKLGFESEVEAIDKVIRVGQKVDGKKIPIKIICNKKKLQTESCCYKIANDSTKMQQDQYKAAKRELTRRNQEGEDLVIRYIKGVPSVVAKKAVASQEN